jgi:UDP-N-acetylglucosamine 2-epimerase
VSPERTRPKVLIVAGELGPELADALGAQTTLELVVAPTAPTAEDGTARPIGERMVVLEELAGERKPDAAVIGGDPDEALAAAITFSKLELPIAHVGSGGDSGNGVIAKRLCDRTVGALSSDEAVEELTAWIFSRAPGS